MIQGVVNAAHEAVVTLSLQGPDGRTRDIEADSTGSTPLVGMLLLDGHNLSIDVETGGSVVIQARA